MSTNVAQHTLKARKWQQRWLGIHSAGCWYGRMAVEADLRVGSVLGVARSLLVSDVDEAVEEVADRAGVGVPGLGAGGSSGVVGTLLVGELLLGGVVVECLFWHDSVGKTYLGGCHEGECQQKSCSLQSQTNSQVPNRRASSGGGNRHRQI